MTIYLYSGVPGSGKSLHAAADMRFALCRRSPRPVISNVPIDVEKVKAPWMFAYRPNSELTVDWLTEYADGFWERSGVEFREDYITLVLDECQLLFNSREWTAKDRLEWLEFFSQHRKYGYKVLFIAQGAKMVDNQFRMLVMYEINHRKMATAGLAGFLMALPFRSRLFVQVEYMFQENERLGAEFYVARKADMELYDTRARLQRGT